MFCSELNEKGARVGKEQGSWFVGWPDSLRNKTNESGSKIVSHQTATRYACLSGGMFVANIFGSKLAPVHFCLSRVEAVARSRGLAQSGQAATTNCLFRT